jgi:hypothetical protein
MKNNLRPWILSAFGTAAALALSSCADPYYTSVGTTFSSGPGYGYDHGYGSSSFSTSIFVSTGDPRWGYDPYTYCYYDYYSRSYYDPYLYAYYPVGYRPPVVVGVPHPHGWRSGQSRIAPPGHVRDTRLTGYQNRTELYRSSGHSWARQVRPAAAPPQGPQTGGPGRNTGPSRGNSTDRYRETPSSWGRGPAAPEPRQPRTEQPVPELMPPADRGRGRGQGAGIPSDYQTPVQRIDRQPRQSFRELEMSESQERRGYQGREARPSPTPSPAPAIQPAPAPAPEYRQERPNSPAPERAQPRGDAGESAPRGGGNGSRGGSRGESDFRGLGED